jgi:hypothetical protein
MNRIVNEYGALRQNSAPAAQAEKALVEYERKIRDIIRFHDLTPIEIRCLSAVTPSVFAEETLRGAVKMRAREREAAKTSLALQHPFCQSCGQSVTIGPNNEILFNCDC